MSSAQDPQSGAVRRRVMGELHIDNQTRRETASSDYTPLHSAINRAPSLKSKDDKPTARERQLSRSDSQTSSVSNGSARTTNSNHQTISDGRNVAKERTSVRDDVTHQGHCHAPEPAKRTSSNGIYREVTIPNTLQRHGYIADGCKANERTSDSDCQLVIPPPVEFSEPQANGDWSKLAPISPQSASRSTVYNKRPVHAIPAARGTVHQMEPQPSDYSSKGVSLPPKQSININKQGIRHLLVQDMLKRQGQDSTHTNVPAQSHAYTRQQQSLPTHIPNQRAYNSQSQPRYSNYDSMNYEAPLWTPPQQSAYDKGLSHYDRPSYHKRSIYGQVNSVSGSNYGHPSQLPGAASVSLHH